MANDIATHLRVPMEKLEDVVLAIENLCGVSATVDGSNCDQFANLFFFVSKQLEARFLDLSLAVKGGHHD